MVWFVGVVIAGLTALLIWSRTTPRARRELLATPARPIREVTGGFAHIAGEVRADADVLVAPISQRPCVYYSVHVCRIVTIQRTTGTIGDLQSKYDTRPEIVDSNEGRVGFQLADATGVARIDPAQASFEIAGQNYSLMLAESSDGELFARVQSYLRERSVTGGTLEVTEAVLGIGETAHVFGLASAPDAAGVCTFARSPTQPLVIQDVGTATRL